MIESSQANAAVDRQGLSQASAGLRTSINSKTDHRSADLGSIQALRGIAAVSVVAFHTHLILAQPEYGGLNIFGWLSLKGWLGVNFFFVLSGFIIYLAHASDIGRPERASRYFWRRATRIYPLYWILLTGYIAAAALGIGHPDFKWEARHLFSAYSLVAVVDEPTLPLKVAWTLLFEIKFYLLFALCIIAGRLGLAVMALWGCGILLRNCFEPLPDWGFLWPDWGMLSIWNIYFLMGALAAYAMARIRGEYATVLAAIGAALVVYLAYDIVEMGINVKRPALMVSLGIAFTLLLLGVALREHHYGCRVPSAVLLIGDASYAIYLAHCAVISQVASFNHRMAPTWISGTAVYCFAFAVSILAGVIVHLALERPVLRWIRSLGR